MIKTLTVIALLVTIAAGSALLYRNQPYEVRIERAGEVKKDQEKPPAAGLPAAPAFGPIPHVMVTTPPVIETQREVPSTAPTPAPPIKKRKPVKKHTAAKKLKSKWVIE